MLLLIERTLEDSEQTVLTQLQAQVNSEVSFAKKAAKAKTLWKTKGGKEGKQAFVKIADALAEMCVSVKTCNYCEGNEAEDIEHIYPKSFFPEKAFEWQNYLLACKQCNSGDKLDKCFVMDADGTVYSTVRGVEPVHSNVAFINPRIDNPKDFLWLNMEVGKFELLIDLSEAYKNKALKTLEILALNERDYLIVGRKRVADELYDKMDRLSRIVKAANVSEIETILAPYHGIIDATLPIETIKYQVIETTKQHIYKLLHPSVWYAIQTIASKVNSKWEAIFEVLPEALEW
ncbi:hypothetical protein [Runella aurantiaca]|uniref:HNH endonuclease n=1 Tax=Runella aurantiaca TaxID=2282308 RepID=A0A369I4I5_9BACT|nr:hypothetical protein [Runella aurantiaca]RDB04488.1 hypothetical protein DVG78_18860 [Runella aurantiaca]